MLSLLGLLPPSPAEAFLKVWRYSDLQVSADGKRVAFVASEPFVKKAHRNIWVADTRGNARQFTTWTGVDSNPRFSADGKSLYFLSNRGGDNQIYKISLEGGEATVAFPDIKKVNSFELSPDGTRLAYTSLVKEPPKEEPDPTLVEMEDEPVGLYVVGLSNPKPKLLTKEKETVSEFSWAEKGRSLAVRCSEAPNAIDYPDRSEVVDAISGAAQQIKGISEPASSFHVGPSGQILWVGPRGSSGPTSHDLFSKHDLSASTVPLFRDMDREVSFVEFRDNGSVFGTYQDGLDAGVFELGIDGKVSKKKWEGEITGLASPSAGKYFYTTSRPNEMPEVYYREGDSAPVKITHMNEKQSLLPATRFDYKTFDGKTIESILYLPAPSPGKLPPLIALPHGGPTGQYYWAYDGWAQYLASRGYAVLAPNIRGSTGYGWDFIVCNRGDWGGGDYKDVMAGVDAVVAKGLVDANKLGIFGWSYGGYMSAWAVTQTNRFKAAVIGAPMTNLMSEYGAEGLDTHRYDAWFHGMMWDDPSVALKQSPIMFVKNVHTPCLLLQGALDPIDPPNQSLEFFRALKRYGVESQMVMYPNERHGFTDPKHRADVLDRTVAFLDAHVK